MADVSGVASHSIVQKEKRDYTKLDLNYQGIAFFCLISQLKKERKKEKKKKKGEICEMKQKRKGSVTKGLGSKLGSHQDIFKKMTVDMH